MKASFLKRAAIADRTRDSGVIEKATSSSKKNLTHKYFESCYCNLLVPLKESILWEFRAYEQAEYE